MSERAVWTSPDDHELVVELHKALGGGGPGYGLFHNWHVLRLALTASLRLPVSGDAARGWTGPKSGGPEYRLQQVTGEHKEGKDGPDLTNAFRAVLGSLHGIDLFHRETGEEDLMHLLEYHVHRGLQELHRRREEQEDGDVYALLLRLLAEARSTIQGIIKRGHVAYRMRTYMIDARRRRQTRSRTLRATVSD